MTVLQRGEYELYVTVADFIIYLFHLFIHETNLPRLTWIKRPLNEFVFFKQNSPHMWLIIFVLSLLQNYRNCHGAVNNYCMHSASGLLYIYSALDRKLGTFLVWARTPFVPLQPLPVVAKSSLHTVVVFVYSIWWHIRQSILYWMLWIIDRYFHSKYKFAQPTGGAITTLLVYLHIFIICCICVHGMRERLWATGILA